jgi:intein/homing endonuclease
LYCRIKYNIRHYETSISLTDVWGVRLNAENVTDKLVNVTEKIDKFLWKYPESTPKEVCRCLGLAYKKDISHKIGYGHMVSTRKNLLKKFVNSEIKGHLPKPLVSSHRVEWEIEKDIPLALVLKLKVVAERLKPRLEDPRPVGFWYVIPNRNKQLEYHDDFISVRVFQGTGTCRILPVGAVDFKDLSDYVWEAFLKGGLSTVECDSLLVHLEVSTRHKTFKVPITIQRTFNIDHYKDALGLEIGGDGSHPCLLPGSLIVTKNGLKAIELIQEDDEVLTHKGRFRRVLEVMNREYDGDVTTIKPLYGLSCTLTVDHPIYSTDVRKGQHSVMARNLKWTPAGVVGTGNFVCFPLLARHAIPARAFCSRRDNQFSSKLEVFKLNSDLLRFIGYYVGDGSRTGRTETKIVLGKNQESEALDIQQTVEKYLGSSTRVTSEGNTLIVTFSHVSFQRYLTKCFGYSAPTKHLPWFFLQLSEENKTELLKGLFGSDGSHGVYNGYLRYSFATTSPNLAIQVVQLLLSLGIFASINKVDKIGQKTVSAKIPWGIIHRNIVFNINVNGLGASKLHELFFGDNKPSTTNRYSFNFGFFSNKPDDKILEVKKRHRYRLDRYALVPVDKIDKGHYKGAVFNLRVEEDNSYCLPYLTVHNCHIETKEGWPTWVKPFLRSAYEQTKASEKQTEVITQLTEQMRLHLSVLSSINENFKLTTEATRELKEAAANLAKSANPRIRYIATRSIQQKPYEPIEDSDSRFADYGD